MKGIDNFLAGNKINLEQRFVGFIESTRRRMNFSNRLVSHSYCPHCREYVLAEIQGGISNEKGIKNLYCSCPECYNLITLKTKQNMGH